MIFLPISLFILILFILAIIAYKDYKEGIIDDWWVIDIVIVTLVQYILFGGWISGLLGLLVGGVIGVILFYVDIWGGGDSKLLMAMGFFFGIKQFMLFLLLFFGIMLMYNLMYNILILVQKRNPQGFRAGVFFLIAYIATILWSNYNLLV